MLQCVEVANPGIVRNRILRLQSANSSKTRIVRNTKLLLQSVEASRQGLSGIGY
jgi:hypothetical protein